MKKITDFFVFVWRKFQHNFGLKLLSVFFAILLWNYVISATNPIVTETLNDIVVNVSGISQLSENNLALKDSVASYRILAKVTVDISRNERKELDEDDVTVQLVLDDITTAGTHKIRLSATANNGDIKKISPEFITVEVDEELSRVVPVRSILDGEPAENYHRSQLEITPNSIQVTGAKSIVQNIEGAYVELDLTNKSESISLTKQYIFTDSDSNEIDATPLTVSTDSILLEMSITPIKELYIVPEFIGKNELRTGYKIASTEVQPETMKVTGLPEILEGLVTLSTLHIDLVDRFEDIYFSELKLNLPDGITLLDGIDTVAVSIVIEEEMSEVDFEQVEIELRNIPEGLKAKDFVTKVDIRVRAPINTIDSIVSSHIMLYVDLTGAEEGERLLPILYESPEEYRVDKVILSQENVMVILN